MGSFSMHIGLCDGWSMGQWVSRLLPHDPTRIQDDHDASFTKCGILDTIHDKDICSVQYTNGLGLIRLEVRRLASITNDGGVRLHVHR